jgi:ribosomal-protein-alanine N-acetyltransferase
VKAATARAAILVRPTEPRDAAAIAALGQACPDAAAWSANQYEDAARANYQGWLAEDNGAVVGFIITRIAADEVEILNFAVMPDRRRLGIASQLIERALEQATASGAGRAYLEVRASNRAAIALYEAHGFARTGRRTGYYSSPAEDALLLSRNLS